MYNIQQEHQVQPESNPVADEQSLQRVKSD